MKPDSETSLFEAVAKGFDERNLNNMRAFYRGFPIWNAVRTELNWTHYRLLARLEGVEDEIQTVSKTKDSDSTEGLK